MSELALLIELQAVHDNLRVVQRDLTDFPPDLAALDSELKTLARKLEENGKALTAARTQQATLTAELTAAQKLEDLSRGAMKEARQKVQFTAAIRELDERQRQKAAVAKPLKEVEQRIAALETAQAEMEARSGKAQAQFEELRGIFLSEHENQVAAEKILHARRTELQAQLDPTTVTRFDRLLQQRQGRAVVGVDKGTCGGCRTRLRTPLLAQLREEKSILCESCQRFLYDPSAQS
jgi:predicted  nucleic acid-binding Zn-ribbon protein